MLIFLMTCISLLYFFMGGVGQNHHPVSSFHLAIAVAKLCFLGGLLFGVSLWFRTNHT